MDHFRENRFNFLGDDAYAARCFSITCEIDTPKSLDFIKCTRDSRDICLCANIRCSCEINPRRISICTKRHSADPVDCCITRIADDPRIIHIDECGGRSAKTRCSTRYIQITCNRSTHKCRSSAAATGGALRSLNSGWSSPSLDSLNSLIPLNSLWALVRVVVI